MSIVQLSQTSVRPTSVANETAPPAFALPVQTVEAPAETATSTAVAPQPAALVAPGRTPATTAPASTAPATGEAAATSEAALANPQFHWGPPRVGAGLFPNDWTRMSLEQIGSALGNRFGPTLSAQDLMNGLNMSWTDANRFVQHHGSHGGVPLDALMHQVSRFASGWDQSMTRSGFETAMRNGANSLNFGRFEVAPGAGVDIAGFMEMARRAGAQAPDHLLEHAFNRAASSGWNSDRALLDPSEMARFFGVTPDRSGDFNAAAFARGVDRAATPPPPPPPPPPSHGWNPWRPPAPPAWQPWNPWC